MKKIDDYFDKAMEFLENEDYKNALKYFLKTERLEKGYSSLNIGYAYDQYALSLGEKARNKALRWYKKAINNNDYIGMTNIAVMYKESYEFKKAKKWFKKSIKCGDNETYLELAKLYLMEGKIKQAVKCLQVFEGDRLKLNISEGGQEDALEILHRIQKDIELK